jgi:hypothetical protein
MHELINQRSSADSNSQKIGLSDCDSMDDFLNTSENNSIISVPESKRLERQNQKLEFKVFNTPTCNTVKKKHISLFKKGVAVKI